VKGAPDGLVSGYRREMDKNASLELSLRNSERAQRDLEKQTAATLQELKDDLDVTNDKLKRLTEDLKELDEEKAKLTQNLAARDKAIKELKAELEPAETAEGIFVWPPNTRTYILIGGVLVAAAIAGAGVWLRLQGSAPGDESLAGTSAGSVTEPAIGEAPTVPRDVPAATDQPETTPR
jgi:hypothetical protein